jgi:hypothetical protein
MVFEPSPKIWLKFPSIDWLSFENHSLQAPLDSSGIRSFEIAQKQPKKPVFVAKMVNLLRNQLPKGPFLPLLQFGFKI